MIVFAYNFHHRKTQDFLFYCRHYGYTVDAVLAADWRDLGFPEKGIRTNLRPAGMIHPSEICRAQDIPYYVVDHNSAESLDILDTIKPEIGLISGARILSRDVIGQFSKGVINFHLGLIPETRGLDCAEWAIYENLPFGITSHLIDGRVDAGRIIKKIDLPEYPDDTLIDIGERLHQWQLEIFSETIDVVDKGDIDGLELVEMGVKSPYGKFPPELESELLKRFTKRFPLSDITSVSKQR